MIELKFEMTKEMMKIGVNENFRKRHHLMFVINLLLGVCAIGFGIYILAISSSVRATPCALIGLGVVLLLKKQLYVRKVLKMMFAEKSEVRKIHCKFFADELWMKSPLSEGTAKYEAYHDCIVTEKGLLLYPQKNIYIWIPSNAIFLEGDWQMLAEKMKVYSK